MKPRNLKLWRYNAVTGYWKLEREVTDDTAAEWLLVFQLDEPSVHFMLSKNKPRGAPEYSP